MPQNEVAPSPDPGSLIESVITKGDLARLSPQERTQYYIRVCESVGLNPFTRPLEYLTLSGKMVLYARRDAADQLRKINGISVEVVSREVEDDLIVVHVQASDKTGRKDEDFGAVSIAGLKGENKANAILKAITKAKRRVTLSISGLGFLDETEVDDIPIKEAQPSPISAASDLDQFAAVTGEPEPPPERDILAEARGASLRGVEAFRDYWVGLSQAERNSIKSHLSEFETAAKRADDPFDLPPLENDLLNRPEKAS
jgi:hypothetical protein